MLPFRPYHSVRAILSKPFCPITFCPITFCPYHFVRTTLSATILSSHPYIYCEMYLLLYVHVYVCIYVSIFVCMFLFMYVYLHVSMHIMYEFKACNARAARMHECTCSLYVLFRILDRLAEHIISPKSRK